MKLIYQLLFRVTGKEHWYKKWAEKPLYSWEKSMVVTLIERRDM